MQNPEYIYWAAVCLVAWPCALFSRCAGILALTWAVGQIAYVLGAPEPQTQVVLYLLAAGVTAWEVAPYGLLPPGRLGMTLVVAGFYSPLAYLSAITATDPLFVWWGIFTVAMIQVAIVPFTVDWSEVRAVVGAFKQRRHWDDTLFRLRRAVCW